MAVLGITAQGRASYRWWRDGGWTYAIEVEKADTFSELAAAAQRIVEGRVVVEIAGANYPPRLWGEDELKALQEAGFYSEKIGLTQVRLDEGTLGILVVLPKRSEQPVFELLNDALRYPHQRVRLIVSGLFFSVSDDNPYSPNITLERFLTGTETYALDEPSFRASVEIG